MHFLLWKWENLNIKLSFTYQSKYADDDNKIKYQSIQLFDWNNGMMVNLCY